MKPASRIKLKKVRKEDPGEYLKLSNLCLNTEPEQQTEKQLHLFAWYTYLQSDWRIKPSAKGWIQAKTTGHV